MCAPLSVRLSLFRVLWRHVCAPPPLCPLHATPEMTLTTRTTPEIKPAGDRRVAKVVRRAWELGALNAAWWEHEEGAYNAWCKAIDEVGMSWEYRKVRGRSRRV